MRKRNVVRSFLLACVLGVALSACDGSNVFEPCDANGPTPHKPCPIQPA